jgi:hypothetical protein
MNYFCSHELKFASFNINLSPKDMALSSEVAYNNYCSVFENYYYNPDYRH